MQSHDAPSPSVSAESHSVGEDRTVLTTSTDPLAWITATMKRYAPVLCFHPDEEYFTYNVPDYLQNVELHDAHGSLLVAPPLTAQNLPMGPRSASTYLAIPGDRMWLKAGDLAKTRIYVHALRWTHGPHVGVDFQYFFFYPYNGEGFINIRFPGVPDNDFGIPAGAHQGDWESIIVRTDDAGDVLGVYCNQHGSGQWYSLPQLQWRGDQPVIYVARSGHPSFNSIGHFPTKDITINIAGHKVGFQIDNVTGAGRELATADLADLVAASYFDGVTVSAPWWLDYLGRFGRIVYTEQDKSETSGTIARVLRKVFPYTGLADEIAADITDKIFSVLGEINPDGPEPPRAKGWWDTVQADGPWFDLAGRWSGNVKIDSLPGHLDPRSRGELAMANYGNAVCLAYRGESSNKLYSAWYDGRAWRGNTQISTVNHGSATSTHGPALASHDDRLYMVFKAESSNALYLAWFDGERWHGNTPIMTDNGAPESPSAPALASFGGQLHMVFRGVGSNSLYHCVLAGDRWVGNTEIHTDHGVPASSTGPALVAHDGSLFLTFKGESSNALYLARFDGERWLGNTPLVTDHGAPESSTTPWMASFGDVLWLLFKGAHSNDIYLAGLIDGVWVGNEPLSKITSTQPRTSAPGAAAQLNHLLVMAFKGADSNTLYQAIARRGGV